ncbi:putative Carbohydrate esterase family 15 protein [Seiridium cardinale]
MKPSNTPRPALAGGTLGTFVNHAENLPYDAHTIAAALAPRALVIDQGSSDPYTNSKATAIVVYPAAKALYDWLGSGDQIAMAVQKILQGKKDYDTRLYNDLSPWAAVPTTYPWAAKIPKA